MEVPKFDGSVNAIECRFQFKRGCYQYKLWDIILCYHLKGAALTWFSFIA